MGFDLFGPPRPDRRLPQIAPERLQRVRPLLRTQPVQGPLPRPVRLGEQRLTTGRPQRLGVAMQVVDVPVDQAVLQANRSQGVEPLRGVLVQPFDAGTLDGIAPLAD